MRALSALLLVAVVSPAAGRAPRDEGAPVRIVVVDEGGSPLGTARVYPLDTHEFERVNEVTGAWEARVLYQPDGGEIHPEPGMTLAFKVFAPGFAPASVELTVQSRKVKRNTLTVPLVARPVVPVHPRFPPNPSYARDPADPHAVAERARAALDAGRDEEAVGLAREASAGSARILDGEELQARIAALDEIVMIGSWRQWIAAERAYFAAPSDEADVAMTTLRDQAFEAAKRALLTAPAGSPAATLARELCEEAARRIDRCAP